MEEIGGRLLVVFDGQCGFCNRAVRWFLRRDRRNRLRFVASESAKVAELLGRHGIGVAVSGSGPGTILVVVDAEGPAEKLLLRSDAVAAMLSQLPRPWPAVAAALGWIPGFISDPAYRLVARWRHRIWGRLENCPLPAAGEQTRFL